MSKNQNPFLRRCFQFAVLTVLVTLPLFSQSQFITVQGKLIEQGSTFTGNTNMTFVITNAAGGTVFTTSSNVTAANGVYSINLAVPLSAIDPSASASYALRIGLGAGPAYLSPDSTLAAVPYSYYASSLDGVANVSNNSIGIGTSTPSEKLDVVGNIAVSGTVDGRDIATDGTKLDGIEAGADDNNISDINATDLTDGNASTLHYHASDRNRANHSGSQTASTISDFDTEVGNNTTVSANTTHRSSTGQDHTYIDQSVTSSSSPTFNIVWLSRVRTHSYGDDAIEYSISEDGDRTFYMDIHASDGVDYSLRFIRYGGANADAGIENSGTGSITVRANSSGGVFLAAGSTSWAAISDRNAKTNIHPLSDGLKKIDAIEPCHYRYKTDTSDVTRVGVIAQDVQKVLPEAVSQDTNGQLSVHYTELIPLLIASVKELKKENQKLSSTCNKLKSNNKSLHKKQDELMTRIQKIEEMIDLQK